nr:hypothetical protein CFP56_16113 [Quercus suber]
MNPIDSRLKHFNILKPSYDWSSRPMSLVNVKDEGGHLWTTADVEGRHHMGTTAHVKGRWHVGDADGHG